MSAWTEHVARWGSCTDCPLCQQRDRICLARGNIPADIVFIGEAPGASEDAIGRPFVGPAGKLLDNIIDRAVPPGVRCALTNLVCCFPQEAKSRGNNEPETQEILACEPRLVEFVNIARPKLIVCVGSLAAQWIDHSDTVPVVDIVHPAAILRMPLAQRQMATQKSVVVLRNAIDDIIGVSEDRGRIEVAPPSASAQVVSLSPRSSDTFTKWGNNNARITSPARLRRSVATYTDDDPRIPF